MNRRSVLRWLGLAPVAAPAAVAAAAQAQAAPTVVFTQRLPGSTLQVLSHGCTRIRVETDAALASRIDRAISRVGHAEARIASELSARASAEAGHVDRVFSLWER